MRGALCDDDAECRYGDHDCGNDRYFYQYPPSHPVPLVVLVLVAGVEVQGDDIDASETLGVLSMLVLEAEEAPYRPSE